MLGHALCHALSFHSQTVDKEYNQSYFENNLSYFENNQSYYQNNQSYSKTIQSYYQNNQSYWKTIQSYQSYNPTMIEVRKKLQLACFLTLSFLKREYFPHDYQSLNQNSWHKINRLLVVLDHLSDIFPLYIILRICQT